MRVKSNILEAGQEGVVVTQVCMGKEGARAFSNSGEPQLQARVRGENKTHPAYRPPRGVSRYEQTGCDMRARGHRSIT